MDTPNDQQVIINLLTEQNQTLHKLLDLQIKHDKKELHRRIFAFCLHAIPYIVIIIMIYVVYTTLKGYLDTLNADVKSIHDNVTSITDYVKNLPTAISDSIKNNFNSISSGITGLFNR